MFVIGNLLNAVAVILGFLLQSLMIVVFVNALLSWVRPDPSNPIRRLFPTAYSGIDFAPFIAMLALWLMQLFLVNTLRDVAVRMG